MQVEISEGRIILPYKHAQLTGKFTLEELDNTQSGKQRRYYWKCLIKPISDYTGYTKKEAHGRMAYKFLLNNEGKTPFVPSTEDLTPKRREEYHEDIRRFASTDLSMYLELPNEYDYKKILTTETP